MRDWGRTFPPRKKSRKMDAFLTNGCSKQNWFSRPVIFGMTNIKKKRK